MNDNVLKVVNVFLKLTDSEKSEFFKQITNYNSLKTFEEKIKVERSIKESVELQQSVGPKNTICAYCGR